MRSRGEERASGAATSSYVDGRGQLTSGFGKDFFDAYHSINPRSQPYYDERQRLYELYHHLNVSSPSVVES